MKSATNRFAGPLVDLARGADLLHGTPVEDDDAVRQRHRFGLVVRHIDERDAGAALQRLELGAHALAQLGVEVRQRLVEQQDRRLDHQRARQRHALLLATRQLTRMALLEAFKAYRRQNALDALANPSAPGFGDAKPEGDVLEHRHVRPHGIVLEHHAHAALLRRHHPLRRRQQAAAHLDGAGVRCQEARQRAQHGGLAAARRPQQRDELASPQSPSRRPISARKPPKRLSMLGDVDERHRPSLRTGDVGRDRRRSSYRPTSQVSVSPTKAGRRRWMKTASADTTSSWPRSFSR